jgi:Transposase, Mutator family
MTETTPSPLGNVITIDDERIKNHLDRVVRGSVEDTLNALLDAEADRLCNAQRYERSAARRDTRAGHYERKLQTKAGEVRLRIPKLRQQTFETAIIERYRRRESSVEEALIEMYLAGVSVRRVEDIKEALWGTRVSPSTVSELNKKIYGTIEMLITNNFDALIYQLSTVEQFIKIDHPITQVVCFFKNLGRFREFVHVCIDDASRVSRQMIEVFSRLHLVQQMSSRPSEVKKANVIAVPKKSQIVLPIVNCFGPRRGIPALCIPRQSSQRICQFIESVCCLRLAPF